MRAQIVSFHCVLTDQVGKIISSTFNHDVITHVEGQDGKHLQGLIEGLQNLKKGDKRRIAITASQAYGFYDPRLVVTLPRKSLSQGAALHTGSEVTIDQDGTRKVYRVIHANRDSLTLDANHPLAGQDLIFEIEATAAREATAKEIEESRLSDFPAHLH